MLHPMALQQKAFKKRILLSLLRSFNITNKIIFHATNIMEKRYIENQFGHNNKIVVASNYPSLIKYAEPLNKSIGKIHLLTHALISPMKNHLLILQSLLLCKGDVTYDIVGAIKDNDYWSKCLKIIECLPSNISVQYHGEQSPKAIEHFIRNTHLLVMPSESENYGHAIIEGLCSGRPVITSKNTPWNQLAPNQAGFNVGFDVKEIADKINYFIELNAAQYEEHTLAARKYADNNIDFNQIHQQYDSLFA
jgi:glycosyltransferase involved in cell wall biosynthesis